MSSVSELLQTAVQAVKVNLLFRELKDVDWDILGTHLGLSQSEIKEIESDHKNTARRRIVMLDKWLKKEVDPSWTKIIPALEEMSENNLASRLKKKYVYQQDENPPTTTRKLASETVLKVDRKDRVARELESLKENHLRLVRSVESALEAVNPLPRQLKRFSQAYLSNRVVRTVEELFDSLGEFCFLDYALLECIISHFLKEAQPVVNCLGDYIQQLTNFKSSTTLREFMESIQNAQKSKEGLCKVTLRLVGGWLEKTMKDLDRLLKEIFQDKSSILAHLTIERGSVIVNYLVPLSDARSLVELAKLKITFMPRVGVCALHIGPAKFTDTNTSISFEYALVRAAASNEINILTFLLDIKTNPDAFDAIDDWSALMYASYFGRDEAVTLLLKSNANPHIKTKEGFTAVCLAIERRHSAIARMLLQANSDPDVQTDDGTAPLFVAAQNRFADMVSILLEANANPNIRVDYGATPLYEAVEKEDYNIVSLLLQANADPNIPKNNGVTPLFMAVQDGRSDIVDILLQANADPNLYKQNGVTPLSMAAQDGCTDIVYNLLKANANPNLRHEDGTTPIFMASYYGHTETVSLLLKANANPDLCTNNGTTPIFAASQFGHTEIVSILLKANANPNLQMIGGFSPLYQAVSIGSFDTVNILLKANANPNLQTHSGTTPLYIAANDGHYDIVDILLKANANPNLLNKHGATALCIACQEGHSNIVGILLKANANPNVLKGVDTRPPLLSACLKRNTKIVQLLLKSGADPNLLFKGATALMFSSYIGCFECAKLLLKFGADPSVVGPEDSTALSMAASDDIADLIKTKQLGQSSTIPATIQINKDAQPSDTQTASATSTDTQATEIATSTDTQDTEIVTSKTDTSTDNETIEFLIKTIENMSVAKVKSFISAQDKIVEKTLPSKSWRPNQESLANY